MMAKLNEINVNDIRMLIKRLIKEGYDKKVPIRPSEQEILTSFESSLLIAQHLGKIREEVDLAKQKVQEEVEFLQSVIVEVCSLLQPITMPHESLETSLSLEFERLFNSLRAHQPQENDDLDEVNQAIDSDEEAKLFEELDVLMEAQERADTFKGNVHQLMAQTFQKVSRRLVELEASYDLVSKSEL